MSAWWLLCLRNRWLFDFSKPVYGPFQRRPANDNGVKLGGGRLAGETLATAVAAR